LNHRDESSREEYCGDLLELPNWAYSYALALYRHSQSNEDGGTDKCDEVLRSAIRKFPAVVEQLLIKNEVDVSGRSMRSDWPTVLRDLRTYVNNPVESENYNPITQHAARQACNVVTKIFVQRSCALWNGDSILMWLYRNCTSLFSEGDVESLGRLPLSPSLIRYARCDPSDYEDRFQTLPMDANPLDPGLLAPALAVDPNRRRFLRRGDMLARHQEDADIDIFPVRGVIGGPPTHVIDPDSPLMEVFWRSMLPWNRVDGVPPPRR
jgi:Transcriptional repressor TCF25